MTLKQIEYFLKVCELRQISECSKFFGISQSAMSIAIKNLEISLNGNLFDRRGKSLILNERGRAFLNSITPVYYKILEIEKNMRNSSMFDISIMSSQNVGNYLLPYILSDFTNKDFNIDLDVKICNTERILEFIKKNKCDIGLIENNLRDNEVSSIKICNDELVVVTGDKRFQDREFSIAEIANLGWVVREKGSGTRDILFENLPKNLSLNVILELTSTESIKRCIKNKTLFTCMPKFALKGELDDGLYEVKIRGVKFLRDLSIVYAKDKDESETFSRVINILVEKIRMYHNNLTL
ncbi:LysR family transcriptional regulator [Campylobacter geochelonis]|uniref:LysR family transcriptional regulator n=1 Tax=Campylobacter geochelonis TaxID=1780362 RepID=UPI00077070C5|nr:LysR family transcriptional regulator [Campylobacter geochelonis]CZE47060.1 LysR family transcriptional regulator [Campylobacter geochelonis]